MDFKELFDNLKNGTPPKVKSILPIKYATSDVGTITVVKWSLDGSPYGIEVQFPGCKWNTWYWATPVKRDKRSRYLDELELVVE